MANRKRKQSTLARVMKFLKWGRLITKFAAIGTTITGTLTVLTTGSGVTGLAVSAAGASTYAAAKGIPVHGYEKTRHIPPGPVNTIDLRSSRSLKPETGMQPARMSTATFIRKRG